MANSEAGDLTFEDVRDVTVRRSDLVKWLEKPSFEDLITGCFVRYARGVSSSDTMEYRLYMVTNVDATKKHRMYKLDGLTTDKYLDIKWGKESATRLSMKHVSDAQPLEQEFQEWLVKCEGGSLPSRQALLDKKVAIQNINNYVYSVSIVKQEPQEKKAADAGNSGSLDNPDSVYSLLKDVLFSISKLDSTSTLTGVTPVPGGANLQQVLEIFSDLSKKSLTDIVEDCSITAMRKALPTLTMYASSLTPEQAHSVKLLQLRFDEMVCQYKEFTDVQREFKNFEDSFGSSLKDLTRMQQEENKRQAELSVIAGREKELEEELARLRDKRHNINQDRISSSHSIRVSALKIKELVKKKPQMEIKKNNSKKGLLALVKEWDNMRYSFL